MPKTATIAVCLAITLLSANTQATTSDNKTFQAKDGTEYTVTYNGNGAVLKQTDAPIKLYLFKNCKAFSNYYGKGTWDFRRKRFTIHFKSQDIKFRHQKIEIKNAEDCHA